MAIENTNNKIKSSPSAKDRVLTSIVFLCRIIIAITFIFSGYVKAIDPIGTQYKIDDYLAAINLQGTIPDWITLLASVAISNLEFCIGVFLLFAIRRKLISRVCLAFMVIMTLLTIWLVWANPIKDCGCFGDAIKLTNGQTLLKNIILLVCAIIVYKWPRQMIRFISKSNQWIVINYTILFIFISSSYCLYKLPIIDFRPYHVGANIIEGMQIPAGAKQPQFETIFIMEKNGIQKEFTLDHYPDSTWTFVDSKTTQTEEGYIPPIHDFFIQDHKTGEDISTQILHNKGYTFILISPHVEQASDSNFGDIELIYEYAQDHNIAFIGLTASDSLAIEKWRNITGAEYPFYTADETTLKTMIRSNPGLMLIKNGTIIKKWSHNDLPDKEQLSKPLSHSDIGKLKKDNIPTKILTIIIWFILPLFLLTLANRLWAWSKWIKQKENSNKIYQLLKQKK